MDLKYTRSMVRAAIKGQLRDVEYKEDPIFGLSIPVSCPDVPAQILNPRNTWADQAEYDKKARELAKRFHQHFASFKNVSESIRQAGPKIAD
jgi:phosphoenolpyruvate carboxykinase (ATP)